MTNKTIMEYRQLLFKVLSSRNTSVTARKLFDFNSIDDSIFYATDGRREMTVSLVEDSPRRNVDYYFDEADDVRAIPMINVNVPNGLDDHIRTITTLFDRWFSGDLSGETAGAENT